MVRPPHITPLNAGDLSPFMRCLLYAAGALVLGVGVPLLLLPDYTDLYFPFPIDPSTTAGFLGACYVAAGVLEILSAHSRRWDAARIGVPGVMIFTVLTCSTTLSGLEKFTGPRPIVWIWTAVYAITPLLLAWAWIRQRRTPASQPEPPLPPLPGLPNWSRAYFAFLGGALTAFGLWLRVAPESAGAWWPWPLSSPTSYAGPATMEPYAGAWMIGLGIVALGAATARSAAAARPALIASVVLCALVGLVLVRDADAVRWLSAPSLAFGATLATLGIMAALGLRRSSAPTSPLQ